MHEHKAATIVPAPVESVYELFTHFHRYPVLMRHVRSVTFYDDQNCHWVVDIGEPLEWDAVNEGWQKNARIGWRATRGSKSAGEVLFQPLGKRDTRVFVRLLYDVESAGERDLRVDHALQQDLDRFAFAVAESLRAGEALSWNAIGERQAKFEAASEPAAQRRNDRGTIEASRDTSGSRR